MAANPMAPVSNLGFASSGGGGSWNWDPSSGWNLGGAPSAAASGGGHYVDNVTDHGLTWVPDAVPAAPAATGYPYGAGMGFGLPDVAPALTSPTPALAAPTSYPYGTDMGFGLPDVAPAPAAPTPAPAAPAAPAAPTGYPYGTGMGFGLPDISSADLAWRQFIYGNDAGVDPGLSSAPAPAPTPAPAATGYPYGAGMDFDISSPGFGGYAPAAPSFGGFNTPQAGFSGNPVINYNDPAYGGSGAGGHYVDTISGMTWVPDQAPAAPSSPYDATPKIDGGILAPQQAQNDYVNSGGIVSGTAAATYGGGMTAQDAAAQAQTYNDLQNRLASETAFYSAQQAALPSSPQNYYSQIVQPYERNFSGQIQGYNPFSTQYQAY